MGTAFSKEEDCIMAKDVNAVTGFRAGSASPTDIWLVSRTNDMDGVLKMWIPLHTETPDYQTDAVLGLAYESRVYTELIGPKILDRSLSPCFVKCYAAYKTCTFDNLRAVLEAGKIQSANEKLERNLTYIEYGLDNRPAINDDITKTDKRIMERHLLGPNINVSMFLLESMAGEMTFYDWFNKNKATAITDTGFSDDMWRILAQMATACYAMATQGLVHHDLHGGNFFIQTSKSHPTLTQRVGSIDITYTNLAVVPKIYDFDGAYAVPLGNNPKFDASANLCPEYGYCNTFINNYDILKVFNIIWQQGTRAGRERLLNFATKNEQTRRLLASIFTNDVFMRYRGKILSQNDFALFHDSYTILQNICRAAPRTAFVYRKARLEQLFEPPYSIQVPAAYPVYSSQSRQSGPDVLPGRKRSLLTV